MSAAAPHSGLIRQVYAPPLRATGSFSVERFLGTEAVRYYSLGRHALAAALRLIGAGPGDYVAMPEFICRDLLAAVAAVGAEVCFYPVGDELGFAGWPAELPAAKAIIAVNYFGFPQDLGPFEEIAARTGATLIEDNAHGFLSRDEQGTPLGRRAPLGVFSLRKTLPLPDGAALVANEATLAERLPAQLSPGHATPSAGLRLKQVLRKSVPVVGIGACRAMTAATRFARRVRTGHAIAPTDPEGELSIPFPPEPGRAALDRITQLDEVAEIARRRKLYEWLDGESRAWGAEPIFKVLPKGAAPYVFPFRASRQRIANVREHLGHVGLECHLWPDLPGAVLPAARENYKNVWMVPFLW